MPFAIIALIVALLGSGGAVYASQDAVPGSTLYGVKTIAEQAELAIPSTAEGKADRYLKLASTRLSEMEKVDDPAAVRDLGERYASQLSAASSMIAQADADGRDASALKARFGEILADHTDRIGRLAARAPEAALAGLDQALDAALTELERPLALAGGRHGASPSKQITPTEEIGETKSVTESTWYSNTLSTIKSVTGTVGISLTQAFSDVIALSNDQEVPGESFRGLAAKLRAAAGAIGRGQPAVAQHQLEAFLHHLDAMKRSNHISATEYNRLNAAYQPLSIELKNAAENSAITHGKGAKADDAADDRNDSDEQDESSARGPKSKPDKDDPSFPPAWGRR